MHPESSTAAIATAGLTSVTPQSIATIVKITYLVVHPLSNIMFQGITGWSVSNATAIRGEILRHRVRLLFAGFDSGG